MSGINPIKLVVAFGAASAMLLAGSAATAQAQVYPPAAPTIAASSTLSNGYATVTVTGTKLTNKIKVKATYKKKSTSKAITVNSDATVGTAKLKVTSILPSTAGRYKVTFSGNGVKTTQTYTRGKAVTLKSVRAVKTTHGITVTGKARKGAKVSITVKRGTKTVASVKRSCNSSGNFQYWYKGNKKGTYKITVKYVATKSYFGANVVTLTVKR